MLAKKLADIVNLANSANSPSASIMDGISLVRKVQVKIPRSLISLISLITCLHSHYRVDVIMKDCFAVYNDNSIKATERQNRGSDQAFYSQVSCLDIKLKKWRRLRCWGTSKSRLIQCLADDCWKSPDKLHKLKRKIMYVTSGKNWDI